jgi:hypothetical protein
MNQEKVREFISERDLGLSLQIYDVRWRCAQKLSTS